MTKLEKPLRPIRSYVLRQGRMTPGQQRAFTYWPNYGLEVNIDPKLYHFETLFGRVRPLVLEIGFGMGDSLIAMAKTYPDWDFIGIEVHRPGVGRCLAHAQSLNLTNLRVFAHDAVDVFQKCIPNNSLDKVFLLFPDPWPKVKHHKRRIVQSEFVHLVASKLKLHGQFHLATDWQPYADHMLVTLDACSSLRNAFGKKSFAPEGERFFQTKFESRGRQLGHVIWDLIYLRV